MLVKVFVKDPDSRLDYGVDWSDFLTANDDTVSTATFVNTHEDLLLEDAILVDGVIHACFISGGVLGRTYHITSRIVTAGGRTKDHSFALLMREK